MAHRRVHIAATTKQVVHQNGFYLLQLDVEEEEEQHAPVVRRGRNAKRKKGRNDNNNKEAVEAGSSSDNREGEVAVLVSPSHVVVEDESCFRMLDDFLLSTVFSWLLHAPSLDRARGVCRRWQVVIDSEKRLWKALVWREFRWKKDHGKRAKKNRKKPQMSGEEDSYRHHYIRIHQQHKEKEAAKQRQARERWKIARLFRTIVPWRFDCVWPKPHPWLKCKHEPEWLVISDEVLKNKTLTECNWCECTACGAKITITQPDKWRDLWPDILDVTADSHQGYTTMVRHLRMPSIFALDVSNNRLEDAHSTYSTFLKSLSSNSAPRD